MRSIANTLPKKTSLSHFFVVRFFKWPENVDYLRKLYCTSTYHLIIHYYRPTCQVTCKCWLLANCTAMQLYRDSASDLQNTPAKQQHLTFSCRQKKSNIFKYYLKQILYAIFYSRFPSPLQNPYGICIQKKSLKIHFPRSIPIYLTYILAFLVGLVDCFILVNFKLIFTWVCAFVHTYVFKASTSKYTMKAHKHILFLLARGVLKC